jgi:hypothetical protein
MARRGGSATRGRTALADRAIDATTTEHAYARHAEAFRQAELRHLRENVGGGALSPGVRMLVKLGARQSAAALHAFDEGRDADGNKLAEGARQSLLAAHAKAAKEAAPTATTSPLDALRARAAELTKTTPAIAPEKADRE